MITRRFIKWSLGLTLPLVAGAFLFVAYWPKEPSSTYLAVITAHTVDDPVSAFADSVDLAGAKDFKFTFGDGSGWAGYNVLKTDADGHCEYTFLAETTRTEQVWKRAGFNVDAKTLGELRLLLADVDFFRFKKEYDARGVEDGTQRWAKVEASGKRKSVYCNNVFPPSFERIQTFVNDRIIAAHAAEIGAAKVIHFDRKDAEPESFD